MSGLQERVDEYLRLRRALGFKLKEDERTLGQLVGYLEAAGASTVTSELANRLGPTACRGASEPMGEAAADRAGVRRLPANDRPDGRDPAAGRVSRSAVSAPPRTCSHRRTSAGC